MTVTANYGWTKPTVGGDANTWGSELNSDLDGIDSTVFAVSGVANAALPKAGGTLTGSLTHRAGAAGSGSAPAYFQAGALLTAPEAHALEWDGANLYATQSAGPARKTVAYLDSALSGNTTGSAAKLTTGRTIAMTGDVSWTSPAFDGSGNVTAAGTIAAGAVTNAKHAAMADQTIKGNVSGGSAAPSDLTAAQVRTMLNVGQANAFGQAQQGIYFTVSGGVLNTQHAFGGCSAVRNSTGNYTVTLGATALVMGFSQHAIGAGSTNDWHITALTAGPLSAGNPCTYRVADDSNNTHDATDVLILFY